MNSGSNNSGSNKRKSKRRTLSAAMMTIGYILSPLSWWNDLFVNVPLAYTFAFPFSLVSERLFLSFFILGYWLSNLIGFILLHRGFAGLISKQPGKVTLVNHIIVTFLYTGFIMVLVWLHWIPMPDELIK